ncbi:hypothetical protein GALL_108530 [mine drainage metagenome]|uniref:Uncharacterized protein n=1 Tax=mine drainage metagenome TaxID=410659 RepID=A0A1J5SGB3_9ZZZZ
MKKIATVILLLIAHLLSNAQNDVFHKTEDKIKNLFGKKHKEEKNTNAKENISDADAAVKAQKENLNKLYALKSKDFKSAENINVIGAKGSYQKFKDKNCGGFNVGWDADDLIIKGIKDPQPYLIYVITLFREWAKENEIDLINNKEVINGEEIVELAKKNLSQGYIAAESYADGKIKSLRIFLNDSKYDKDVVIIANNTTSNNTQANPATPSDLANEEENLNKIYALKAKDFTGAEKEKFNTILGEKGMYVLVTKEMGGFYSFSWESGTFCKPKTLIDAHKLLLQWAEHNAIVVNDTEFEDKQNGHQYTLKKDKKIGSIAIKRNDKNDIIKVVLILNDTKYTF